MSDSNITKHALAQALKDLLKTRTLDKVSVGNICEACGMNRKSFYYHFRDKYDLVNWIYYTEFIVRVRDKSYVDGWEMVEDLCNYFYENRKFYQNALRTEGQNSLSDYLRDVLTAIFTEDMARAFEGEPSIRPYAEFYADAFLCALKKWLLQKDCRPPHDFSEFLKKCLTGLYRQLASYETAPPSSPRDDPS